MITLEQLLITLHEKIQFVTGDKFFFEKDFNEGREKIVSNYISAIEEAKKKSSNKILQPFLRSMKYYPDAKVWKIDMEEANKIFEQYYIKTDTILEKIMWNEFAPLWFRIFVNNTCTWEERFKKEYLYYITIMEKAEEYIKCEDLSKVTRFYINLIVDENPRLDYVTKNSEKSIKGVYYNDYDKKFVVCPFFVKIYLLSSNRIVKIIFDDKKLITSEEHIIQKDLKKVEINNDNAICFHYHGLHAADVLVMDNYGDAVKLRTEISKLREQKGIFQPKA